MNEIVQLINEAQKRFSLSSYKEVHKIISTMPESMKELRMRRIKVRKRIVWMSRMMKFPKKNGCRFWKRKKREMKE